jgi:hypothetical protein
LSARHGLALFLATLLLPFTAEAKPPKPAPQDDGLGSPVQTKVDLDVESDVDSKLEAEDETEEEKFAEEASGRSSSAMTSSGTMHKRKGFGAIRTLSAANGLWGEYFVSPTLSLGLIAGVATFAHRETDENGEFKKKKIVGMLSAGPSVMVWPARLQADRAQSVYADVGVGGRALVYWGFRGDDGDDSNTLDTPLELDLEVPIALRIWFGANACITPEFGLVARWVPGSREPDQNGDFDKNPGSGVGERLGTSNGPGLGLELGNHTGLFFGLSLGYFYGR